MPDPRQADFLARYLDPTSPTYSNGLQSALAAGYSQEYAEVLVGQMPTWLSEKLKDNVLLEKADKNLEMALEGLLDDPEGGKKDIQWKATQFVKKGLEKAKWSERVEHTGEGGEPIKTIVVEKYGGEDKATT